MADAGRAGSLKRPRESTPAAAADAAANLTPAKFARLVDSKRFASAAPLTGLAAREDELRRQEDEARLHPPDATSAGAAQQALAALRGAEAMSRAAEAAVAAQPTADSSEAAKAFNAVAIPTTTMATAHTGAASPPERHQRPQSREWPPSRPQPGSHGQRPWIRAARCPDG